MNATAAANNPLLQAWDTPHGLPPFQAIEAAHFGPALDVAMAEELAELQAIADDPAAPSFDNTVAALDRAGARLDRILSTFHVLAGSATSPQIQAVQRDLAAPLAAHVSAVYMNTALFRRIDALHAQRAALGLNAEQLRLLERVHLDFVRAGARLQGADRARYTEIMAELAQLTTRFGQNVLHDENTRVLQLPDEAALEGLPAFLLDAARQAAAERGLSGHVITPTRSLVVPFLTFSPHRGLREQAWRLWVGRGEPVPAAPPVGAVAPLAADAGPDDHDNREIVRRVLTLRQAQAQLHGHACFADYALADTMAGTRAAVAGLLDDVWQRARPAMAREEQMLREAMQHAGAGDEPLQAWDWRWWAERVRRERFAVDDAEVKPYFPLPAVAAAAFDCAQRLFGLKFTRRDDIPVYHPDVVAYEVHDANARLVGVFLQDDFARSTKRSGAWMSALRWQSRNVAGGGEALPIILNNSNFAKGAPGSPTLLSLDDARTLFHEFGHALHGLLSQVTYDRLSGTKVLRDFVELPSQIFEHWITEPEVLARHARHCETGEPMPAELVQRLQEAARFNQGYETIRYTASALLDMAVHAMDPAELPADLCAFEADWLQQRGMPAAAGPMHRLVHFQHLFAGSGYAAGYYVYLWAEVLDADGYQAFKEAGSPFAPEVAARLLRHIYAAGNSVEPRATYVAFRGREARLEPLLAKRGLLETA